MLKGRYWAGLRPESPRSFVENIRSGGGKETTLDHLRHTYPERIVTNAIKGMLPHNRLGRKVLSHLKVYAGAEHPHHAQQPQELKI